jgi:hypothetical protein
MFSAYLSGIRDDFHPAAWVIAAKSMSSAARSSRHVPWWNAR